MKDTFYQVYKGSIHEGACNTHNFKSLGQALEKAQQLLTQEQETVDEIWGQDLDSKPNYDWHVHPEKYEHIKFHASSTIYEIMVCEATFDDI